MGRIRNAVSWLTDLGAASIPTLEFQPPAGKGGPILKPATASDVPDNMALTAANFSRWVHWLRANNIFYSSPLDLDMMMLTAFPDAYKAEKTFDPAKVDKPKLDKSVFGEKGRGNADLNAVGVGFTDEQLYHYKALFKSSSKPGSHLLAFGKLTEARLKAGCPEPLKSLINQATSLIASARTVA